MNRNLLLAMTFCVIVSTLFTGCDSSGDKGVDYTSVRNKEAALVAKIRSQEDYYYWIADDSMVQEFVDILDTEREAAMTYGFDSLSSCCVYTYDLLSDDSLVREFGCVEGSMACGTIFARLYRDGDKVRFLPGNTDDFDLCISTQDIFNVAKGKYIVVSYSRSGQDEFLFAFLHDFNGDTPTSSRVAVSKFRLAESGLDCEPYKWDRESKTLWLPCSSDEDHSWDGEYTEYNCSVR